MSNFKLGLGDRVRVRAPGGLRRGIIKTRRTAKTYSPPYTFEQYGILLDDDTTITYHDLEYVTVDPDSFLKSLVCECASDKLNHPGHSPWCNRYKKEVEDE